MRGSRSGSHPTWSSSNTCRKNRPTQPDIPISYILRHEGVWATTADDIAEYYLVDYYDQVKSWIAERKVRLAG